MDNYGVSRKRMYPRPKIEKAAKEARQENEPCHGDIPSPRRLNEARQAAWRKRHFGAAV